jgi:cytidine deaminase
MMWNLVNGGNVAMGMNSSRKLHGGATATRHAEVDAMLRLPGKKRGERLTNVSLVVVRVSSTGELRNSKPCMHCLKRLQYLHRFGYNLCSVYYSNEAGGIVKAKYEDLLRSEVQHVSRGNRK